MQSLARSMPASASMARRLLTTSLTVCCDTLLEPKTKGRMNCARCASEAARALDDG